MKRMKPSTMQRGINEMLQLDLTFEDKIEAIFEALILHLSPMTVQNRTRNVFVNWGEYKHQVIEMAICTFRGVLFASPFPELQVVVFADSIVIRGSGFYYSFAPENILWIHKEIKRAFAAKKK